MFCLENYVIVQELHNKYNKLTGILTGNARSGLKNQENFFLVCKTIFTNNDYSKLLVNICFHLRISIVTKPSYKVLN